MAAGRQTTPHTGQPVASRRSIALPVAPRHPVDDEWLPRSESTASSTDWCSPTCVGFAPRAAAPAPLRSTAALRRHDRAPRPRVLPDSGARVVLDGRRGIRWSSPTTLATQPFSRRATTAPARDAKSAAPVLDHRSHDNSSDIRLARRAGELVVTGYRRTASRLRTWEPAAPPSTGHDGGRASNNTPSNASTPRWNAPVRTGLLQRRTGRNDALPRRSADGATDRSRRAAAGRSRSGARPPAGIEPGNKAAPRPLARWQSRWSSGGSRFVYLSSRPAGTGRGCSVSSPVNWTTAASTTGTYPASAGHWSRSCSPTGGGPAGAARPTSPECLEPELPYGSFAAQASTVTSGQLSWSGSQRGNAGDGGGDDPADPTSPRSARHWPCAGDVTPCPAGRPALWPSSTPRREAHGSSGG
jgi:hypothetical protein